MLHCLMLDVDGVLVTGRPRDGLPWAAELERDLGIDPGALQDAFFTPYWEDIVLGRRPLFDVLRACLPQLAPRLTPQDFVDYWFAMDSRVNQALLAECDRLRSLGVRVVLATNQEHQRAAFLMQRMALGQHVDGIVYSARLGARKPQPAFFRRAAAELGLPGAALFLVDDSAENVAAARTAGWQAAHWTGTGSLLALLDQP